MCLVVYPKQDMTWWLDKVKIAKKSFDVLSKGKGQAMSWWPKNLATMNKGVLAFSCGTNQVWWLCCMEDKIIEKQLLLISKVLIKWFSKLKVIAQGNFAQDIDQIERATLFEEWKCQVNLIMNFYFLSIGIWYYQYGCNNMY